MPLRHVACVINAAAVATTNRHGSGQRRSLISWPLYRLTLVFSLVFSVLAALVVGQTSVPPAPSQTLSMSGRAVIKHARAFRHAERATHRGCCAPGSADEQAAAHWLVGQFGHFDRHPEIDQFATELPWQARPVAMSNVVAYHPGSQPGVIVVIAHRDGGGAQTAVGTAMLIELGRLLAPLPLQRGIALVSTDGGTTGGQGADQFARTWPLARHVVAAVVLDSVGGPGGTQFRLMLRSQSPRGTSPTLVAALRSQLVATTGHDPQLPGAYNQLSGYAVPYASTEQGPLLARGIAAIGLTGGPSRAGLKVAQMDPSELGDVGTAVVNTVVQLDAAPTISPAGPPAVFLGGRVLRGWLVQIALSALLAPVVVCVLDLVAGLRRRRLPIAPGMRALAWRCSAWLVGLVALWVVTLLPGRLISPVESVPLPGRTAVTTAGILLWLGLAFLYWRFVTRPRLVRMGSVTAAERTGGLASGLLGVVLASILLVAVNPFALILVLPAAHAWLWLAPAARAGRRFMLLVWLVGLIGPLLALFELWHGQGLGSQAPRAVVAMIASGYMSPAVSVCLALFCAAGCQLASLVLGRYAPAHRWIAGSGRRPALRRPVRRRALSPP
ncbi:MAG: M28 family peptidase [Gaiellales bacterium]